MNLTVTDRISSQLHALLPKPCVNERPFVCDGLPADCVVMVVGENPGMRLETDWWTFWDDASGFDFQNFHLVFEAKRKSENKQLRAFWRLKRLRETGLRCLETNVFRNEGLGGAHAGKKRGVSNDDVLRTFLKELPLLKAIIAHGKEAQNFISSEPTLPPHLLYRPMPPFKFVSYDDIDAVAREIFALR